MNTQVGLAPAIQHEDAVELAQAAMQDIADAYGPQVDSQVYLSKHPGEFLLLIQHYS